MTEVDMIDELTHSKTTLRVKKAAFGGDVDRYLSEASLAEAVSKTALKYTDF
jgi:hypothetical protein